MKCSAEEAPKEDKENKAKEKKQEVMSRLAHNNMISIFTQCYWWSSIFSLKQVQVMKKINRGEVDCMLYVNSHLGSITV